MESSDLRTELECSICLEIYKDPVMLRCGHNFCCACLTSLLDTQEGSGVYACPECRWKFTKSFASQKNLTLSNIVKLLPETNAELEGNRIRCTYCITFPVNAVKSCLLCEASLCDNHLQVHSKSAEHILIEPTTSWSERKCPLHNHLLRFYCCEDDVAICDTCFLEGEHKGHKVELLNEGSEKKENLKLLLEKPSSSKQETRKRVHSLERHSALVEDVEEQLLTLKKKCLSVITNWEEQSLQMKAKKEQEELDRNLCYIEELYKMAPPLPLEEEGRSQNESVEDTQRDHELDESLISQTISTGLADILDKLKEKRGLYGQDMSAAPTESAPSKKQKRKSSAKREKGDSSEKGVKRKR